jgi:Mrp family chromosome partitioning ATPase
MVGSTSDGALYVIESGRNLPKSIRWAINRLQKANVKIYGLALTKFDAGKSGLSYSYSYEYGEDERPATT